MNDDGTIKPGHEVDVAEAVRVRAKLEASLEGRLDSTMSPMVPLACRLLGEERGDFFDRPTLDEQRLVFALYENTNELRRTTISDLREYLECKEPWEDYDICVFDDSLEWCVGCTHNDKIIVMGEVSILSV